MQQAQHIGLLLLVVAGAGLSLTVQERVEQAGRVWAVTMAHCGEYGWQDELRTVNQTLAGECKQCFGKVGDWATVAGLERGRACIAQYEPAVEEECGQMLDRVGEGGFQQQDIQQALVCWENCNLHTIAEKCSVIEDHSLAWLCMLGHRIAGHQYAELAVLGEDPEEKGGPLEQSRLQRTVDSILTEGRCIHNNEGNQDRINECIFCFDWVQRDRDTSMQRLEKIQDKEKRNKETTVVFKRSAHEWSACNNVYLAPAYNSCFDLIDTALELEPEEWGGAEGRDLYQQVYGCLMATQTDHWAAACKEAAGPGTEGLLGFHNCARNSTLAWVAARKPEAVDMVDMFMKGMGETPENGGLLTSLL